MGRGQGYKHGLVCGRPYREVERERERVACKWQMIAQDLREAMWEVTPKDMPLGCGLGEARFQSSGFSVHERYKCE